MHRPYARKRAIVLSAGLIGLAYGQLVAQQAAENSATFELEVVRSGRIDSSRVLEMMDMSLFNPADSMEMKREVTENEPVDKRSRNGGFRSGGGGAVVSGSSMSIGAPRDPDIPHPNYQIEVALSRGRSMAPLEGKIVYFYTDCELVDDAGKVHLCPIRQGTWQAPGMEATNNENSRFLYVYVPESATLIKSIKGHLIVSDGYSFEAYVRADELDGKVRKPAGEYFVDFETVFNQSGQLNLNVSFPIPPSRAKDLDTSGEIRDFRGGNIEQMMEKRMGEIEEMMKLKMWEQFNRMVVVIAKGDDNRIYTPSTLGGAGAGGAAGGNSTGGGSGGGTGNESGDISEDRLPQSDRRRPGRRSSNAPRELPMSGVSVGFTFPDGVRPVAVKCIVHQRTSEIEGIPFVLANLPVNDESSESPATAR